MKWNNLMSRGDESDSIRSQNKTILEVVETKEKHENNFYRFSFEWFFVSKRKTLWEIFFDLLVCSLALLLLILTLSQRFLIAQH